MSRLGKYTESESRLVVPWGWWDGGGVWVLATNWYVVSFGGGKNIVEF